MILTIGNIKGGVGKTTLAVNITIALALARQQSGRDVLLVDGDEQGTAATFTQIRAEEKGQAGYTCVRLHGAEIRAQVHQMRDKYSDIIIDVGGRDTGSLRAALTVSDAVLIPVQPRSFDIWSMGQIDELISEAKIINDKLKAYAVINQADPVGHDNADTKSLIAEDHSDISFIPNPIVRRKAFANAGSQGLSVLKNQPRDPKATEELLGLLGHFYSHQNDIQKAYNVCAA